MANHDFMQNQINYVDSVISMYLNLPDTPIKPSFNDRFIASTFFAQNIPINTIQAALLLASLRRCCRQDDLPPLAPVRSLAYFIPVVDELAAVPLPDDYILYLRAKLLSFSSP